MLSRLSRNIDDECHICLEKKSRKDVIILGCSHSYHASCLFDWFDRSTVCPICMEEKKVIFSTISRYSFEKKKQKMKKQCCNIL